MIVITFNQNQCHSLNFNAKVGYSANSPIFKYRYLFYLCRVASGVYKNQILNLIPKSVRGGKAFYGFGLVQG